MPSKILANKTPLGSLQGFFPTEYFPSSIPPKVFGLVAFVHISARSHSKLELKALKYLFVDYFTSSKGLYLLLSFNQEKVCLPKCYLFRDSYFSSLDLQGENRSSEDQPQNIFPLPKWEDIVSVDTQDGASGQGENVEKIENPLILPATENGFEQVRLEVSDQFQSQEPAASAPTDHPFSSLL